MRQEKRVAGLFMILAIIVTFLPVTSGQASTSFIGRNDENTASLLQADLEGITVQMEAPAYQVREMMVEGNRCGEIAIAGFASGEEPGRPRLPYRAVLLGVPPDAELSLEIAAKRAVPGRHDLAICPAAVTATEASPDGSVARQTRAWAPDASIYSADAFYPAQIARLVDLGFMRSQRIVRLEYTPVQVNPQRGELRFYPQVQLRVKFSGRTDTGRDVSEPADFEAIYRNTLLNYEAARSWRAAAPLAPQVWGERGAGTPLPRPLPYEGRGDVTLLSRREGSQGEGFASKGTQTTAAPDALPAAAPLAPQVWGERGAAAQTTAAPDALPAGGVQPPAVGEWMPPTPGYRIAVESEGIYQLTYADLVSATLPVDSIDPRTFKMYNLGQELAIQVIGEADGRFDSGDSIVFYGRGVNTRYTTRNIYWLTYGGANGKRMADQASVAGGTAATSFTDTIHIEQNLKYISTLPMADGYDHWYDNQITVLAGATGGRNYGFTVANPASGSYSATLEVMLGALPAGAHHLRLYVGQTSNLRKVLDASDWYDKTMYHATVSFPQDYLAAGSNVVRVEIVNDRTAGVEIVHPDWLEISYRRGFTVTDDYLAFGGDQAGRWRFTLEGFSTADVDAYDVTDPTAVKRIVPGAALNTLYLPLVMRNVGAAARAGHAAAPTAAFTFAANQAGPRRYVALTAAKRKTPAAIEAAQTPDNLLSTSNRADYLIISHPDFLDALDPLVTQRTTQGLTVKKINVQDVYDQFGYGMMSAEAIHAFLAYAYARWQTPRPAYVLLVGDGTYDLRGYLGTSRPTYLPPYLAMIPDDPDTGESVADNRFVTITPGDRLPDMHIGRFPVNSAAEAAVMVSKTLGYENNPAPGDWTQHVLFVADDPTLQGGGDFYGYSDTIADGYADPPTNTIKYLPAPYTSTKVYMGNTDPRATCPTEDPSSIVCRRNAINAINAGALMVSYIGHGTKTDWSSKRIMDLTALASLTNADKLTIMLPMTCDNGYFAQTTADSFGEASVRMNGGGAVASWSPTGFGLASGHDLMERGFFLAVFHDHATRIGAATTAGKVYLVQNAAPGRYLDLLDTYLLLGDPALRIPVSGGRQERRGF